MCWSTSTTTVERCANCFELLTPGGIAILSVPLNASRQDTYENPGITTPGERFVHFSGDDHKRYYGLDFTDRLAAVGFIAERTGCRLRQR